MSRHHLNAYARRIRDQRRAHAAVSEPALAPAFQTLIVALLPTLPTAPHLEVVAEFSNPGVGRPDIALKRPGQPARAFLELKAPAKPADPRRWRDPHDKRQFERFKTLRSWATSNFADFCLFEREDIMGSAGIVPAAALDPATTDARAERLIASHDPSPFLNLLARLAQTSAPSAASAAELAANLAHSSRLVRATIADRLAELATAGATGQPLQQVRDDFRDVLYAHPEAGGYSGASFDELFSGAFAQTLAFGLLLVREATGAPVDARAWERMPAEHPLMRTALRVLSQPEIVDEIGLGFEVMIDTVNSFDAALLAIEPGGRDPILYFYEDFLGVFDPRARERYGVYYTPVEVVRYMVAALDRALIDRLGTQGLRDPGVAVLDPAVGTGTFLLAIAQRVREAAVRDAGPGMANMALQSLAGRMFGFELLVGPYAVAHYRLHHALRETPVPGAPAPPPLPRLGVYLADTLGEPGVVTAMGQLGIVAGGIREERSEANRIKTQQPVLAIIGNPPYRRLEVGEDETLVGHWMNELWDDLKAPVRDAGWGNQLNTFPELSVAFWRWAMWKLFESDNAPQRGVVAFITNRTFLAGKPYAGLRRMLREKFDRIDVIDLRGDVRRGERAGVIGDQGVFNIQVGTAITLAIADGSRAADADGTFPQAEVRYLDSWVEGMFSRAAKLAWLDERAETGVHRVAVAVARGGLEDMKPMPFQGKEWPKLDDCFSFRSSGLESKRDQVVYGFGRDQLITKLQSYLNEDRPNARRDFNPTDMNSFDDAVAQGINPALPRLAAYRPLDRQWHYPHRRFNDRLRTDLLAAWGNTNECLFSMPSGTNAGPAVWAHALYPDRHAFRGSYGGYAFPLYDRRPGHDPINLSPTLLTGLAIAYGAAADPQDVFDAILALLSATSYTHRFAEDLEDVFPHVPFPADPALFATAARIGRAIREVETFAAPVPGVGQIETAPSAGAMLAPLDWRDGGFRLCADGSGEMTGIPEAIWSFAVSGYRLLPRWLAARVGQPIDQAMVDSIRDIAGRIARLIDLFADADTVLAMTLDHTLSRAALGMVAAPPAPEPHDG